MAIQIRASAAAMITASGNWADKPTYAVIRIGSSVLDSAQISPALASAPGNGDALRIINEGAPFNLTITGTANNDTAEAALNAIISAGLDEISATVSLHDGAPGSAGTANEIAAATNPGYARIPLTLESAVV